MSISVYMHGVSLDDREFCSGRQYASPFSKAKRRLHKKTKQNKNQDDHGRNLRFLESLRTLVRGTEQDCHEGFDSQGRSGPSLWPDREKIGLVSRIMMRYGVWVRGKSVRGLIFGILSILATRAVEMELVDVGGHVLQVDGGIVAR